MGKSEYLWAIYTDDKSLGDYCGIVDGLLYKTRKEVRMRIACLRKAYPGIKLYPVTMGIETTRYTRS